MKDRGVCVLQFLEMQIFGHDLRLKNSNSKYSTVQLQCNCILLSNSISGGNLNGEKLTLEHSLNHPQRMLQISLVIRRVWNFATPWITAHRASLSITNSQSLQKPLPIESVMPSSHLILYQPLLLLPPILPSISIFSNVSTLRMRWPKYWSFSFSISPSNEHPGLISFRMDCFGYPWSPRDSQECSPTRQLQSMNSLALSFLHHHGICSFIHPLWSCNKPNMLRLCHALRQIPTSLEEKPDEPLGLHLVVNF